MLRNIVPVSRLEVLREGRLIMVIAHVLILMTSYLYARRLLGTFPALLGFLLIAFDPFHLGLTRLLHLDGLMTTSSCSRCWRSWSISTKNGHSTCWYPEPRRDWPG